MYIIEGFLNMAHVQLTKTRTLDGLFKLIVFQKFHESQFGSFSWAKIPSYFQYSLFTVLRLKCYFWETIHESQVQSNFPLNKSRSTTALFF